MFHKDGAALFYTSANTLIYFNVDTNQKLWHLLTMYAPDGGPSSTTTNTLNLTKLFSITYVFCSYFKSQKTVKLLFVNFILNVFILLVEEIVYKIYIYIHTIAIIDAQTVH